MTHRPEASRPTQTGPQAGGEAGFSLIELIIALAVIVEILVIVLVLFDVNGRVAGVQMQISDMQQSTRVAHRDMIRLVQMAGRGGVPQGLAVTSQQNVPADTKISSLADAPTAMEGTDVLTVRGVFSTPIFQIDQSDANNFVIDSVAKTGSLKITSLSPSSIPQSLLDLEEAATSGNVLPEALILVSAIDDGIYALVELTGVAVASIGDLDGDGINEKQATLDFRFDNGTHTNEYLALSSGGGFPAALTEVAFAGVVEEYRYYIREKYAVDGDNQSDLVPGLARARMYPGTEAVYEDDVTNATLSISEDIVDFQLAFGMDRDGNGQIDPNPADDLTDDDWLYNASGDDEDEPEWNRLAVAAGSGFGTRLYYLRLSTVARTSRPDRDYLAPRIENVEDRQYNEQTDPVGSERENRMYHRRLFQTTVDMRNVG